MNKRTKKHFQYQRSSSSSLFIQYFTGEFTSNEIAGLI